MALPQVVRATGESPLFAVVDVETSGLRPRRDHLLQIAVVTVDADGNVVDRWTTLVRLRHWWHRVGPRHIHGITRRRLRPAPAARDALRELASRLDGRVFTAHNADFDAEFIEQSARRVGVHLVHRAAAVHPGSVPSPRSRTPAHPRARRAVRPLRGGAHRPPRRPRRRHRHSRRAPPPPPRPAER